MLLTVFRFLLYLLVFFTPPLAIPSEMCYNTDSIPIRRTLF